MSKREPHTTHHKDKGTKGFFHRHKTIFTVVGACIVLMTFIVKEVLDENVRKTLAAIDSASQSFEAESSRNLAQSQSNAVEAIVSDTQLDARKKNKEGTEVNRLELSNRHDGKMINDALRSLTALNQSIRDLLKPVPQNTELLAEVDILSKKIDAIKAQTAKIGQDNLNLFLDDSDFQSDATNRKGTQEANAVRSGYIDARYKVEFVTTESNELREKALEASKKYRETVAQKSERFKLIGNILYGIGWIVGLGGQMLGFGGGKAE
jgi:hypothetical protein